MTQQNFYSLALSRKELRKAKFLKTMDQVIPWEILADIIKPHYVQAQIGPKRKPLKRMLKISCLQQWYNLSDPGVEEEIYDRSSFQEFLELDLLDNSVPDETTILNFRHLLEKHDLFDQIFEKISEYLELTGFKMTKGTIVDATIISAPSSTKNATKKRDPEMSSTKKNNQWYFGMKAHIGVDAQSGIVHSVTGTAAKVHDIKQIDYLMDGREDAIFGDKAYNKIERKREARECNIYYGITDKNNRSHKLSPSQIKRNKKYSSVRAKVEHPFQVIKCQWNYRKVRYKGIQKNLDQIKMLFTLYNLFKARNHLLTCS
jgi:transposase, IS5 family